MGRGNVCVRGEYETLFYIDYENFSVILLDDDEKPVNDRYGNPQYDYELERIYIQDALENLTETLIRRFPSMRRCNDWLDNRCRAILENCLFTIAVEDNEWSIAIELLQKEQSPYHNGNIEGLQARHFQSYRNGLRDALFEQFEELGVYGGAWTSGRIRRAG